jgi:hypothetical protein
VFVRWILLGCAIGCSGRDSGRDDTSTTPPTTDTSPPPPPTDTLPHATPFVPVYFNLDAQLPIGEDGLVHSVTWPNYGEVPPNLTVWMGGRDWVPGDWGDETNLCAVQVDVSAGTPGGDWVAENGQWWGFDAPPSPGPMTDDCWNVDPDLDVYAIAGELMWSVGIGPLLPKYASTTDDFVFGGYALSPSILYPDPQVEGFWVSRAYEVDPDTNEVVVGADFYPVPIPADEIQLPGGGVKAAIYQMSWFGVVGPYDL